MISRVYEARFFAVALLLVVLAACSGGGGSSPLPAAAQAVAAPGTSQPTSAPSSSATPIPSQTQMPASGSAVTAAVPLHVQTAEYLQTAALVNTAPSVYAPYLTYAYTKSDRALVVHNAGIKVVQYTNPLMPGKDEAQAYPLVTGSYASVASTSCSGKKVMVYNGTRPLPNMLAPYNNGSYTVQNAAAYITAVFAQWQNYMTYATSSTRVPDAWFVDNATDYGASTQPCGDSSEATWAAGIASTFANVSTNHPIFMNALSETSMPAALAQQNAIKAPNVTGAEFERCYGGHDWSSAVHGDYVSGTEKDWYEAEYGEINTIAQHKTFWCYNENTGDAASIIPYRMYAYASFLLSYDPQYAIFQTAATAGSSGFKVFPESGFVPLQPALTASDVSGYQQAGGVYERQFGACYYRGKALGACAVVVNPTGASRTLNAGSYHHAAALSGSGVLDGGSMSFNAAVPSALGPTSAAILVQ